VTFGQPASDYPDTAPNTSSANEDQYAGALAAAATCGADVSATLTLATDQGTQQVPVVLPTGTPSDPGTHSSVNVPQAIPDDSSAGTTSTLTIGAVGVIKDVDVRIPRITHGWVGDLAIELSHTDGPTTTTVELAEHPGGPDNSGKNFTDTVFDDEAAQNVSSGAAPYTGSFRPQNDELSRFDGMNRQGTWTLRVRDLFEGDAGTLDSWGTTTQTAVCARNPQTTITAGPPADEFVENPDASFQFTATEAPGSPPFECRLDDEEFAACEVPGSQTYDDLPDGQHTFEVRAVSAAGEKDPSPATRTWAVDTVGPAVDIDQPMTMTTVTDPTPTLSGTAGTAFGDLPQVTVEIRDVDAPGDPVVQTLNPTANGSSWSATAAQLADGEYRIEVEQIDEAGHSGNDTAEFTLVGDFVDPVVSIDSPADGSSTADSTPAIAGRAGTALGDLPSVRLEIFDGPGASGTLIHTVPSVGAIGGAWSTEAPQLALGDYSARATQMDTGNNDGTAVVNFTVVDGAAPSVTITSPASGSTTSDTTPQIAGGAGTEAGDQPGVTVRIRNAAGGLVQELGTSASGGTWSTTAGVLAEGTYTVQAQQSDASGNVGSSAASTFRVDTPDPPADDDDRAPSFVLAPAEERIADALAGRLTAVAGCASACRIDARLTASSRAARSLGLGAKSTVLGKGSKRLSRAGTAAAAVRLNKRARAALRLRDVANLSLRLKLTEGGKTLALSRTISLRRSAGLRRVVSRGLGLWAVCSERCPLSGKLTLSAKAARRIGLKPRGSKRMQVAAGKATAQAGKPTRLTLKVRPGAKKAMRKARRLRALLETVTGSAPNPRRKVSRALTLRR